MASLLKRLHTPVLKKYIVIEACMQSGQIRTAHHPVDLGVGHFRHLNNQQFVVSFPERNHEINVLLNACYYCTLLNDNSLS